MNNQRRKQINEILSQIQSLNHDLSCLKDEEEEAYENMPESFQAGEKGDNTQRAISALDDGCNYLDDVEKSLQEAME